MLEAAEQARRRAEEDRDRAERERRDAEARRSSGDPDAGVWAAVSTLAVVSLVGREAELAAMLDRGLEDAHGVDPDVRAALTGDPAVGLTTAELREELSDAGAPITVAGPPLAAGAPDTTPGAVIAASEPSTVDTTTPTIDSAELDLSPQTN